MSFKCGIVGLPNVGKSTLFNALTQSNKAEAANYPFATIEPNIGRVAVPDDRLDKLAIIGKSEKIIPSFMDFVDIAGLVKGASKGEGLGNQFLSNIRETNAIIHVLRCYENDNITHVEGSVNPYRDKEIIDFELQIKDLETIDRLWIIYSTGRFGFSIQAKILKSVGKKYELMWPKIGWKKEGLWTRYPGSFRWSLDAPDGHMPLINQLRGVRLMDSILKHPAIAERHNNIL